MLLTIGYNTRKKTMSFFVDDSSVLLKSFTFALLCKNDYPWFSLQKYFCLVSWSVLRSVCHYCQLSAYNVYCCLSIVSGHLRPPLLNSFSPSLLFFHFYLFWQLETIGSHQLHIYTKSFMAPPHGKPIPFKVFIYFLQWDINCSIRSSKPHKVSINLFWFCKQAFVISK